MNREDFINAGFTPEQADSLVKMFKSAIDGNYVPKDTFNAEREKVKAANDQIQVKDNQIAELSKFKGSAEELQQKVATLTEQRNQDKANYDAKVKEIENCFVVKASLSDSVYDADDVMDKLDFSKIVIQDGKVVSGLNEQIDPLKSAKPHWFKPTTTEKQQESNSDTVNEMFRAWGVTPKAGDPVGVSKDSSAEARKFGEMIAGNTSSDKLYEDANKYWGGTK